MPITLITMYEKNPKTGKDELIVSHGLDDFMRVVILPTEHPASLGAVFDDDIREWILPESAIGSKPFPTASAATSPSSDQVVPCNGNLLPDSPSCAKAGEEVNGLEDPLSETTKCHKKDILDWSGV
ncbi:hypothetical protein [Marinobacterium sp. BA1]|uniref:hypothetical protein n=1 Tax=Marinobacterium sp. BA1 TaxID=3138931 RepID=UPI0032E61064